MDEYILDFLTVTKKTYAHIEKIANPCKLFVRWYLGRKRYRPIKAFLGERILAHEIAPKKIHQWLIHLFQNRSQNNRGQSMVLQPYFTHHPAMI